MKTITLCIILLAIVITHNNAKEVNLIKSWTRGNNSRGLFTFAFKRETPPSTLESTLEKKASPQEKTVTPRPSYFNFWKGIFDLFSYFGQMATGLVSPFSLVTPSLFPKFPKEIVRSRRERAINMEEIKDMYMTRELHHIQVIDFLCVCVCVCVCVFFFNMCV